MSVPISGVVVVERTGCLFAVAPGTSSYDYLSKIFIFCHSFNILWFYRKPLFDIVSMAKGTLDENEDHKKFVVAYFYIYYPPSSCACFLEVLQYINQWSILIYAMTTG